MTIPKKIVAIILIPFCIALVAVGFITYNVLTSCSEPVVKTDLGSFQGLHSADGEYVMYLGIPYAQVDSANVYGPAIPQPRFDEMFIADNDSAICPQFEEFNKVITGTLDCLRLNVYTPKFAKSKNRHPVLVFIHGGDYKAGFSRTSLYGPKYLIKYGIVLVTLNYRLGPYGFMCSDVPNISNQGLKDQILALKWIKKNIAHFGGNPNKVTIAGVGSGGQNVNLHLLYDTEQLFQKAIIDSGIYLKDRDDTEPSAILELADELGFETKNESDALSYLNRQNIKSVIAAAMKLHLDYGPCIEKQISEGYFVSNSTSYKNINRVPILISHSNKETLREYAHRNLDRLEYRNLFSDELSRHFDLNDTFMRQMEKYTRHFYIGNEKVGEKTKQKIVDFTSDLHHNYPTKRMIDTFMKNNARKIYYIVFAYTGGRNFAKSIYNISMDGATRDDVLGYLFDTPYVRNPDDGYDDDQLVIDYMTTLWTNFVKYGNPTPEKTELLPIKWEPISKDKLNFLEVSYTLSMQVTPVNNRTAYWDLFYKLNGKQERTTKYVEPWRI